MCNLRKKNGTFPTALSLNTCLKLLYTIRIIIYRFFFGGQAKKKVSSTSTSISAPTPTTSTLQHHAVTAGGGGGSGGGSKRRGSDRSLSGSAHELAICGIRDTSSMPRVPHSHSQSNLTDIPYR